MGEDISVKGSHELEALARRLKEAGGAELRKEMLRGFRAAGKDTIKSVRTSARSTLPKSGGLADLVAKSSFGVRTRLAGDKTGVQIKGTGKTVRGLRDIDAGHVKHPVFARSGDRKSWAWVVQSVKPGFFSDPIQKDLPQIRSSIQRVMADVARKIEGHA